MTDDPENTQPELLTVLEAFFDNASAKYHGPLWGEVATYTAAKQTCDIRPMVRIPINGQFVDAPVLRSVPVRQNCGKSGGVTIPLAAGDICMLEPLAADHSAVIASGTKNQDPPTARRFSISDICAIPCFRPLSNPLPTLAYHATSPVFSGDPVLLGDSTADALAARADLADARITALQEAHDAHKHTGVTTGPETSAVPDTIVGSLDSVACTKVKIK